MGLSVWQVLIIVLLIVLLFGRGKISDLLGDLGRGITSFKSGLKEGAGEEDGDKQEEETKSIPSGDETVIEGEATKEREQT